MRDNALFEGTKETVLKSKVGTRVVCGDLRALLRPEKKKKESVLCSKGKRVAFESIETTFESGLDAKC